MLVSRCRLEVTEGGSSGYQIMKFRINPMAYNVPGTLHSFHIFGALDRATIIRTFQDLIR
jgi:hypothetical protein